MSGQMKSGMKTTGAATCMKILLMTFNFIFWVSGIAILGLGIWMKVELYMYMNLTEVYYDQAPWVLIGVGAGIIVIGSLGCCCTWKGKACPLYLYAGFLILIFIAELCVSISAFLYKGKIEEGFEKGIEKAMLSYRNDTEKKDTIDSMQQRFKCCGSKSYTEWYKINWSGQGISQKTPESCCKTDKCDTTKVDEIYDEGCYKKVSEFSDKNFNLVGGVAIGFSFLQLLGAVLACCLAKNINKSKYEQVA